LKSWVPIFLLAEYETQEHYEGRKLSSMPPIESDLQSTPLLSSDMQPNPVEKHVYTKICKFYSNGACRLGKRCGFIHNASSLRDNAENWERPQDSGWEISAAQDEELRFLREFKSLTRELSGEDSDTRTKLSLKNTRTVSKLVRSSSSLSTQVGSSSTSSLTGSSDLMLVYESC